MCLGIKSFGRTRFLPRSRLLLHRKCVATSEFDSRVTLIGGKVFRLRGGEISLPNDANDEEEETNDGVILKKMRNIIRNILNFGDEKFPSIFSELIRSCIGTIESATGISLLPQITARKKTKANTTKNGKKQINKEKLRKSKDYNGSTTENVEGDNKRGNGGKKTAAKKKKHNGRKKSTTTATKSHLESSMKSTNPNYRIQKELKELIKSPPSNLSVQVGSNIRIWVITLVGAKNTIYEGEAFKLRVSFPPQYPTVPPSVYFLKGHIPTHEHVYTNGDICLSLLGKDWRPTMSAQSVAVSILSILSSAQSKSLPMDNASHATNKPGKYQKDWVYHDDNC